MSEPPAEHVRPLPTYAEALTAALSGVRPSDRVERVDLAAVVGRTLTTDQHADRDYPPFNRAAMDGYAVQAADVGRAERFAVVGEVPAGTAGDVAIQSGQAVRIATGAPVPPTADAVIPHELSDRGDPVRFTVEKIEPGANIHPRGADARHGDVVLRSGTQIAPHHLGILATIGCASVEVVARPRIAILTSGDEVVAVETSDILPHQIRNGNAPMLSAMVAAMGGEVVAVEHLPDEEEATVEAVRRNSEACDVLISVGGISAGERDRFKSAFERLGVVVSVRGAAIQPGKPIFLGQLGIRHSAFGIRNGSTLIIGLPGNPVSVLATAHLFLWPVLRRLSALEATLPWTAVRLGQAAKPNPRRQAFRPARWDRTRGEATVEQWAGSGDLIHTGPTHGLLELPMREESVEAGTPLRFLPWAWTDL